MFTHSHFDFSFNSIFYQNLFEVTAPRDLMIHSSSRQHLSSPVITESQQMNHVTTLSPNSFILSSLRKGHDDGDASHFQNETKANDIKSQLQLSSTKPEFIRALPFNPQEVSLNLIRMSLSNDALYNTFV